MHSRIPQASLRTTWSTSGSREAQPAPGLLHREGREITRLNLGKWLWLQGWPEQLNPVSYPAKSQTKQNSSRWKGNLVWSACSWSTQQHRGHIPGARLCSLPSGTQCPTSSVWENCSKESNNSVCTASNPWNLTRHYPAQSFHLQNLEGKSLGGCNRSGKEKSRLTIVVCELQKLMAPAMNKYS